MFSFFPLLKINCTFSGSPWLLGLFRQRILVVFVLAFRRWESGRRLKELFQSRDGFFFVLFLFLFLLVFLFLLWFAGLGLRQSCQLLMDRLELQHNNRKYNVFLGFDSFCPLI